jgi:hypothetical protein
MSAAARSERTVAALRPVRSAIASAVTDRVAGRRSSASARRTAGLRRRRWDRDRGRVAHRGARPDGTGRQVAPRAGSKRSTADRALLVGIGNGCVARCRPVEPQVVNDPAVLGAPPST